jgi:serine/threonine protein kinase
MKFLRPELSGLPEEVARFYEQGRIQNSIPSRHVLPALFDGLTADDRAYLVFPWLQGETVDARARRRGGRLSANEVLCVLGQATSALRKAHRLGIVHRDLKAENLFLEHTGLLYVLDWGSSSHRGVSPSLTQVGAWHPFTAVYAAPEQARGEEATIQSDLFSLGATAWELVAGQLPRQGSSIGAILFAAMSRPLAPVLSVAPEVPADLAALIDKATAFEPKDRYPDIDALAADLGPILRCVQAR